MKKILSEEEMKKANNIMADQSKELVLILRAHLILETYLDDFIVNFFKKGDLILKKMSFYQKITIIEATGEVDINLLATINKMNEIRNKFAHNLKYQITSDDINGLSNLLFQNGQVYKRDLHTLLICILAISHGNLCKILD